MTEEFRKMMDELATGVNFPENGAVLCTAIRNEEKQMLELSCHIDGDVYAVSSIVELIIKHYLGQLDDETLKRCGNKLIDIINTQMQGSGSE